jgi:hypothetical protein
MNDFNPGAMRAKLALAAKQGQSGADKGLLLGGEHLLGVSRKFVPHEEGTLENSGKVSQDTASHTVAVSYDTEYAVRQHEELDYKHDDGRRAKYLEQPMHTESATIAKLAQGSVKKEMGL